MITGYGTDVETGLEYYTIRNTVGTDWGENGYMRIIQDDFDMLDGSYYGICSMFLYSLKTAKMIKNPL
jgi:hypothetical protein